MLTNKLKILRITTLSGSMLYLIDGQLSFMRNKGFEVYAASADGEYWPEIIENEGIVKNIIPFERDISILKDMISLWETVKLVRRIRPDIVHTHTPKAGLIGMIVSKSLGVKIRIHTVAGMPLITNVGLKKGILFLAEKLTYMCSTETWPNSFSLYNYIVFKKLAKREKLSVIGRGSSNGIDLSHFTPNDIDDFKVVTVKNTIDYNSRSKYFLFVGRLVRDKGIEELVESFLILKTQVKNVKLILVGYFEDNRDPLSEEVKNIILNDKDIIYTGFQKDVKHYMYLANFFVFPSHREGFPNVLLQAGAMKCPILCSNIMGNVDVVEHNLTGRIFEVNNVSALLQSMIYAIKNEQFIFRLAERLYQRILKDFDRKIIHEKIFVQYQNLLNR